MLTVVVKVVARSVVVVVTEGVVVDVVGGRDVIVVVPVVVEDEVVVVVAFSAGRCVVAGSVPELWSIASILDSVIAVGVTVDDIVDSSMVAETASPDAI